MSSNGTNGHAQKNPLDEGTWVLLYFGAVAWLGRVINEDNDGHVLPEAVLSAEFDARGHVDLSLHPIYVLETAYVPMQNKGVIAGLPLAMGIRMEHKIGMPEELPPVHLRATSISWLSETPKSIRDHLGNVIRGSDDRYRQSVSPIASASEASLIR